MKVGYGVYKDKEYIHTAELFDGKVQETRSGTEQSPTPPTPKPAESHEKPSINPVGIGRCWNDVASYLREGKLEDVFGKVVGRRVKLAYLVHIFTTLEIPFDADALKKQFDKED